jgi:hypothetical protein
LCQSQRNFFNPHIRKLSRGLQASPSPNPPKLHEYPQPTPHCSLDCLPPPSLTWGSLLSFANETSVQVPHYFSMGLLTHSCISWRFEISPRQIVQRPYHKNPHPKKGSGEVAQGVGLGGLGSEEKKLPNTNKAGRVAQVFQCLPGKYEALSSNPSTSKKKKNQCRQFLRHLV